MYPSITFVTLSGFGVVPVLTLSHAGCPGHPHGLQPTVSEPQATARIFPNFESLSSSELVGILVDKIWGVISRECFPNEESLTKNAPLSAQLCTARARFFEDALNKSNLTEHGKPLET